MHRARVGKLPWRLGLCSRPLLLKLKVNKHLVIKLKVNKRLVLKSKVNKRLVLKAGANCGRKRQLRL